MTDDFKIPTTPQEMEIAVLNATAERLAKEVLLLRGALDAQQKRDDAGWLRVRPQDGTNPWGCDTSDALADLVLDLRERLAKTEALFVHSQSRNAELLDALDDMVNQHCSTQPGESIHDELQSYAISSNAEALRTLAMLGRVKLRVDHGRLVTGNWIPTPNPHTKE